MKTAIDSGSTDTDLSWPSFTVFSGRRMLSAIGNDLRHLYDDSEDMAQPDDLLRLARLIDAKRTLPDMSA